jgi:endonuclease III-like uncharacterized protein
MQNENNHHLSAVLKMLEKTFSDIVQSRGYNKNSERIKILAELIREQIQNENTDNTTRTTR